MYYLSRQVEFEASHRYWNPEFSKEQNHRIFGKCVSPHGHGHNYTLRVTLSGSVAPHTGMVINIKELDRILKELAAEFDHKFINLDHPAFQNRIPTTEIIALYIRDRIEDRLRAEHPGYQLFRVTLYEEPTLWADVLATEATNVNVAALTKTFYFSAARRLYRSVVTGNEDYSAFGNHNTIHGHGYELAVTVRGTIDPSTGMVIDLGHLMQVVHTEVLDRFDYTYLNEAVEEFSKEIPTGENITRVIWALLKPKIGTPLLRVALRETPQNIFEYYGK